MGISRIIGKVFGYAGRKMTSAGARFEAKASKYTAKAVKSAEKRQQNLQFHKDQLCQKLFQNNQRHCQLQLRNN